MLKQVEKIDDGIVVLLSPALVSELREMQRICHVSNNLSVIDLIAEHSDELSEAACRSR